MKCMPSFIKIGGAVSEKNGQIGQTFVVLYIGCHNNRLNLLYLSNRTFLITRISLWNKAKAKIFAFSYQKQTVKEFKRSVCSLRKKPLKEKRILKEQKKSYFHYDYQIPTKSPNFEQIHKVNENRANPS